VPVLRQDRQHCRSPAGTGACHVTAFLLAGWQLPQLDSHQLADGSLQGTPTSCWAALHSLLLGKLRKCDIYIQLPQGPMSKVLRQCFEERNQIGQVIAADIPARHIWFQLRTVGVLTFHNRQTKFLSIEFVLQD